MAVPFPNDLRVLGLQVANIDATSVADRNANLAAAVVAIKAQPGHDVYVLPEMSAVGYSDEVMRAVAAPNSPLIEDAETGPSFQTFAPLARELGCFIVFGFPRRDTHAVDGKSGEHLRPTISQTVVGPEGTRVCTYDKLHLCNYGDCAEGHTFRKGDHMTVFEAQRGFKVGVLICYDVRFPEVWGCLARDHGVDVVVHPSCFPNDGSFVTWHPFVKTRAVENGFYVLSLSRAHPHFGCSIGVGPVPEEADSHTVVLGTSEDVLPLLVSKEKLQVARREYTFRADRRSDYEDMSKALG